MYGLCRIQSSYSTVFNFILVVIILERRLHDIEQCWNTWSSKDLILVNLKVKKIIFAHFKTIQIIFLPQNFFKKLTCINDGNFPF